MRGTLVLWTAAGLCAVGCVLSWIWARSPVDVAPIVAGQPATTGVAYNGAMLALALVLAALAGVFAVIGIARTRRGRG